MTLIELRAKVYSTDEFRRLMAETAAFESVAKHAERMAMPCTVYAHPRSSEGWLGFILVYAYADSMKTLTVHMIQRQPDAEFEFQS